MHKKSRYLVSRLLTLIIILNQGNNFPAVANSKYSDYVQVFIRYVNQKTIITLQNGFFSTVNYPNHPHKLLVKSNRNQTLGEIALNITNGKWVYPINYKLQQRNTIWLFGFSKNPTKLLNVKLNKQRQLTNKTVQTSNKPDTEQFWEAVDNFWKVLNRKPFAKIAVLSSGLSSGFLGSSIGNWGSLISLPFALIPSLGPLIFFPVASLSLFLAFTVLGLMLGFASGARMGATVTFDPEVQQATQRLLDTTIKSNGVPFPTST